jgi:hypothetical protein
MLSLQTPMLLQNGPNEKQEGLPQVPRSRKSADLADLASARVFDDLHRYINESDDPRRRLKFMAKRTLIHEKTLQRLVNRENKPTYVTVFKIYRFLLNEQDDQRLLGLVPQEVATFLNNANPQSFEKSATYTQDLEIELRSNPVMAEIVVLCATGPIKMSYIKSRFGEYGTKMVETLVQRDVLQMVTQQEVCSGNVQVNMSPETLISIGVQMVEAHAKPEKSYETGENFLGFYAEGLSDAALQKWLEIDAEGFRKKVAVAKLKENRGDLRVFTFMATDSVTGCAKVGASHARSPDCEKSISVLPASSIKRDRQ